MTDSDELLSEGGQNQENRSWLTTLASLPRHIFQPFSLSAVALVCGAFLGIFGPLSASLSCIGIAVLLLAIGLWRVPSSAMASLLNGESYQSVSDISLSTPIEQAGLAQGGIDGLTPLEVLCFLHLYALEGGFVGRTRIFPINYFVDLMTASLIEDHLLVMTKELAEHIHRCGGTREITTIFAPKRGNSLLLVSLARELNVTPMFVKERPLFGKTVEGIGGRPKNAAIVDDISSDGELLVNCVQVMRDHGYEVKQAFVLIDRTEGDAFEALKELGVNLLPVMRLGDQELEGIAERARRTRKI